MNTRQIFLDTETTGLNAKAGDRIVELAAVEAINGVLTGRTFHRYLNPERSIDPRAEQVHGLSSSFLKDKPRFSEVADGFIRFVEGAECLMHNAPFDSSFIDAELQAAGRATRLKDLSKIVCTVSLARGHFPGASVSLDSLLERAGHGHKRGKHSALEDARLLAQVYASLFKDPSAFPSSHD
jgi:DNA polymerase-3 subunit epsilon